MIALAPNAFFDRVDAEVEQAITDGAPARSVVLAVALADGLGLGCRLFGCNGEPLPTDPVASIHRVK
jgi:hypothetical protein